MSLRLSFCVVVCAFMWVSLHVSMFLRMSLWVRGSVCVLSCVCVSLHICPSVCTSLRLSLRVHVPPFVVVCARFLGVCDCACSHVFASKEDKLMKYSKVGPKTISALRPHFFKLPKIKLFFLHKANHEAIHNSKPFQ